MAPQDAREGFQGRSLGRRLARFDERNDARREARRDAKMATGEPDLGTPFGEPLRESGLHAARPSIGNLFAQGAKKDIDASEKKIRVWSTKGGEDMQHRITYADGIYRERIHCEACAGTGVVTVTDTRERIECEDCYGEGHTILELHGPEAEAAALHEGILTSRGAA